MHSAKRLVNMSTHARRHQSASARVGMFASRCPFSQLSKNQVLLYLERSDWFCIIPCGRRCRACGTFPSSHRSSAHLPATTASSDYCSRIRAPACAPFGFGLRRRFPSSSALRCIPARSPEFPCRTFGTRSAFGYPQMNTFSADMPPLPRRVPIAQIELAMRC